MFSGLLIFQNRKAATTSVQPLSIGFDQSEWVPSRHRHIQAETIFGPVSGINHQLSFTITTAAYVDLPTAVAADSPVGYWRLNEDTGSTAFDSSGQGNNLAVGASVTVGAQQITPGDPTSGSYQFPGGAASATTTASIGNTAILQPSGSVTLEALTYTLPTNTFINASGNQTIAGQGNDSSAAPYVINLIESSSGVAKIWTAVNTSNGNKVYESGPIYDAGNAYYVTLVYDSVAGKVSQYLNGIFINSTSGGGTITYDGSGFAIGADGGFGDYTFSGQISDVSVYASALSAIRIALHSNVAIHGPTVQAGKNIQKSFTISESSSVTFSQKNNFYVPTFLEAQQSKGVKRVSDYNTIFESGIVKQIFSPTSEFVSAPQVRVNRPQTDSIFLGAKTAQNYSEPFTISESSSVSMTMDVTYPTPYFLDPIQTTRVVRPQTDNIFNGDVPPTNSIAVTISEASSVNVTLDVIYGVPLFIDSGFPYPLIHRPQTETFFDYSASAPWIAYLNFTISESSSVSMTSDTTYPVPYFYDPVQKARISRPQTDNIFNGNVPVSTSLTFTISESSSVNLTTQTQQYHTGSNFLTAETAKVKRTTAESVFYGGVPPNTNLSFTISESSSVSLTQTAQNYYGGANFLQTEIEKVKRPQTEQIFYGGVPPNTNLSFTISEASSVNVTAAPTHYFGGALFLDSEVAKIKRPQTDQIFNGNVPFNTVLSFIISESSSINVSTQASHYFPGANFVETECARVPRPQTEQIFYGGVPPNTLLVFTISEASSCNVTTTPQNYYAGAEFTYAETARIKRTTAEPIFYGGVPPNTNLSFTISEGSSVSLVTDATYPTPYFLDPIQTTRIVRPQTDNIFNGGVPPNTNLTFQINESSNVSVSTDAIYSVPEFTDSGFPYPKIWRPQTDTFFEGSASSPWIAYENFSISESSSVSVTMNVTYPTPYFVDPIQTTKITRPQTDNIFNGNVPVSTSLSFTISESSSVNLTSSTQNYHAGANFLSAEVAKVKRPQTEQIWYGDVPPTTNLSFTISEGSSVSLTTNVQNYYAGASFLNTEVAKVKRPQVDQVFYGGVPPNTNLTFSISESSSVNLTTSVKNYYTGANYLDTPVSKVKRPQTDQIFNGGVPSNTNLSFTISENSSVSLATATQNYYAGASLVDTPTSKVKRSQTDNIFNGGVPFNTILSFTISEGSSVTGNTSAQHYFAGASFTETEVGTVKRTVGDSVFYGGVPPNTNLSFTISESSSVTFSSSAQQLHTAHYLEATPNKISRTTADSIFYGDVPPNTNLTFSISEGSSVSLSTDSTYPTPYFIDPIQQTRIVRPQTDNMFMGGVPSNTSLTFTISEGSSVLFNSDAQYPTPYFLDPIQQTRITRPQTDNIFNGDVPPNTSLTFIISETSSISATTDTIYSVPLFVDSGFPYPKITRPQTDTFFDYSASSPWIQYENFSISESSSVSVTLDVTYPVPYFIDPIQTTRIVRPQTDNIFNGNVPVNTSLTFTISEASSVNFSEISSLIHAAGFVDTPTARIKKTTADSIFYGGVPPNTNLVFSISESSSVSLSTDATYPTPYYLDPIQTTRIVRPQTDNMFMGGVPSNTVLTFTISESSSVVFTSDATYPTPYFLDPIQQTRIKRPQTDNIFNGNVPPNTALSFTISEGSTVSATTDVIYSVPLFIDSGFPYPIIHRPQTETFFDYSASAPWIQYENFSISESSSVSMTFDVTYPVPYFIDPIQTTRVVRPQTDNIFPGDVPPNTNLTFTISENSSVSMTQGTLYPTPYFIDPIQQTRITRPQTDNIFNGDVPPTTNLTFTISEASSVTTTGLPQNFYPTAPVDTPPTKVKRTQAESIFSGGVPPNTNLSFTISEGSSVSLSTDSTFPTPYFVDPIQTTRIVRPQTDNIFNGGVPSNTSLSFTISESSSVSMTTDATYPTPYFLDPIQKTRITRPQTDNIFNGGVPSNTNLTFTISESSSVTVVTDDIWSVPQFVDSGFPYPNIHRPQTETFFDYSASAPWIAYQSFTISESSSVVVTKDVTYPTPYFVDPIQQTRIVRPQTDNIFNGGVPSNTNLSFTISEGSSVQLTTDSTYPTPYFLDPIQTTRVIRPQTDNIFNGNVPVSTALSFTISESSSVNCTEVPTHVFPGAGTIEPQVTKKYSAQPETFFYGDVPPTTNLTFVISTGSNVTLTSSSIKVTIPFFLDPIQQTKIVRPQTDNIFNGNVPTNTSLTFTISEPSSVSMVSDAVFPTPYFIDPIQTTRIVRPQTDNIFNGGVPSNTKLTFTISESSSVTVSLDDIWSVPLFVDSGFPYPNIHRPQTETFLDYSASAPWIAYETFTISESSSVVVTKDVTYPTPYFVDPIQQTRITRPQTDNIFNGGVPSTTVLSFTISESSSVQFATDITFPTPYFLDPIQTTRITRPQTDNIFNGNVPSNTIKSFTISESSSVSVTTDATYPTPYFLDPIQKARIVRPQTDNIFNGGVPSNTSLTFTISESSSCMMSSDATYPVPYFYDPILKTRVTRPQTEQIFYGGVPPNTNLSFTISESSSVNVKVDPIYSVPSQVDSGFPYPKVWRPQTETFFDYSASSPWVQHETFTISEASSVTVQIDVIYSVPQFNDSGYPLPPVKRTKAESIFYTTKPTTNTENFSISESSSVTLSKIVTKPESISESSSVTLSKQDTQSAISISESSTASINKAIVKSSYTSSASSSATGIYDAIKNSFSVSESSTTTEAKNIIKAITINASSSITVGILPEVFRNFSISEGSTTTETKTVNRSLSFSSSASSLTSLTANKITAVPVSISTGSTVSLIKQVIASKTITEGSSTDLAIAGRSQNIHISASSYVEMRFEEQLLVHPPVLVQGTYTSPTYTVMYWTIFPANTGTVFADRLVGGYPSLGPTSITLQMYQQNKTYGPIPLMLGPVFLKAVIAGYNKWKADGTIPSSSLFYDVNFNGVNCRVELVPDTQVAIFNSIYEALFTPPSLSFVSTILIHYPQAGLSGNFGFSPGVTQFNIEGP